MRFGKPLTLGLALGVFLSVPSTCFAAAGAQALAGFVQLHIINQALIAFWGIAAAAMFYYGARMMLESSNEQAYSNLSNSFIYVVAGFSVIACAGAFASALYSPTLSGDPTADINVAGISLSVLSVANFIITMSAGIFVLIVVLAGLRMVATQGEQGEFDKWKKILVSNCIGVMIMLIAFFIVQAVADRDSAVIVNELVGISLFLLTLIGFVCVVALIVAGILLIVSIEEALKDRAKRIIIGSLIVLAIVLASYTLIITFLR